MAFTPCAWDSKRYSGGASTFFLRLVQGGEQIGGRLQFCANHATLVLDTLAHRFTKVSEGDTFYEFTEPFACSNCGNDLGEHPLAFYGNAYLRGHSETQWYGRICATCAEGVSEDLCLSRAAQRP